MSLQIDTNLIKIALSNDSIYTNATGLSQIQNFYQNAKQYTDTTINIDVSDMQWIDGNMSALVGAAIFRLQKDNNLKFYMSFDDVKKKFNILLQNGLVLLNGKQKTTTNSNSTIPYRKFYPNDKDDFMNYVINELLVHTGMPKFTDAAKDKLIDDLAELCCNINLHSETENPFFVCGQFYPKTQKLIFTVTDLGKGFLPRIQIKTQGDITCSKEAILYAVKGGSSKLDAPGGIHISKMKDFFLTNDGHMHIISGDAYYNTENLGSVMRPDGISMSNQNFMGSTIHLVFNQNTLNVLK